MWKWIRVMGLMLVAPWVSAQDVAAQSGVQDLVGVGGLWAIVGGVAAIGILFCFFGWRFFRPVLAVAGFLTGAGGVIAARGIEPLEVSTIFIGLGAGAILAAVFYFGYMLVVFLLGFQVGAIAGILAVMGLSYLTGRSFELGTTAMMIGLGLVGAVLAIKWRRGIMILWTAFDGAALIVGAGMTAVTLSSGSAVVLGELKPSLVPTIGVLVLGLVGAVFQFSREAKREQAGG